MHFHLPKPLHGWREFLGEIAIIVIGVLIALSAEQLVEHWRWGEKVGAAEQTMDEEIRNSLIAAAELKRLEKCSDVQLDGLQSAIVRGDQATASQILHRGTAFGVTRQWADNAFQATLAAQVSDHLGAEKLKRYSQTYQIIRNIKSTLGSSKSPELAVLYFMPTLPTTSERRDAALREVAERRLELLSARDDSRILNGYAKKYLGLATTEQDYLSAPDRADILKLCEATAATLQSYPYHARLSDMR